MQTFNIPNTDLKSTRIGYGCMKLGGSWDSKPPTEEEFSHGEHLVLTALEVGINFFDHADIYCRGKSELVFGETLKKHPGLRSKLVIQSKCGIRFQDDPTPGMPGRYDFSFDHIVGSTNKILNRLGIETLDILLLHRPDPLVEPEEVAMAFDKLHNEGKVRYFGVSNHTPWQIDLLSQYVNQPLVTNQVELNLLHNHLVDNGVIANQDSGPYHAASGTLDYCRAKNILLQAWSPVARGWLSKPPINAPEHVKQTAALVSQIAEDKGTTTEAVVIAWLLRHPAGIQPIIGTSSPERIKTNAAADQLSLSREEWYRLYTAARGSNVP